MKTRNSILFALAALALPLLFAACSSSTTPVISQKEPVLGTVLSGDTLKGTYEKTTTLQQDSTYYMAGDVIIAAGDTLFIQSGVTIIVLCTPTFFPEFQVVGTMISMGTASQPNYITVPQSQRTYQNLTAGLWGGINGDKASGDLILKFTHVEYGGATGSAVDGTQNDYAIVFQNPAANFIMEDSWITGGYDDPVRVSGGHISLFRNVMECTSGGPNNQTGDGFNCKTGTVGDIGYNLFIGCCTNGPKLANKNAGPIQCNVNIFNNTIVTCGWRYNGTARAGSTDIEDGARGVEFNNIIVNCFTGFRLCSNPLADTAHTYYDYQWYYANIGDSIGFSNVYPHDGVSCQVIKPHDHYPKGSSGVDPMFVNYNVTAVANSHYIYPSPFLGQDPMENVKTCNSSRFSDRTENFSSDFHLASGSPAIGTGYTASATQTTMPTGVTIPYTGPNQVTSIYSASNPYGAKQQGLGADFGAYQTNGSGNVQ